MDLLPSIVKDMAEETFDYDFVVIGSGFGGSVSAMRLTEKGYSVCVLEQGKRFQDQDFPKTNWNLRKFLWAPLLRCFGIQSIALFRNIMVLRGVGVGGGSLVYANTLLTPGDSFFESPNWRHLADWKTELRSHYEAAKQMLGVAINPQMTPADRILKECADEMGRGETFHMTQVGVFFGEPGKTVPDPYFDGKGPERAGCQFCGACMIGCPHNAKNTLMKNYLYFAEKNGAQVIPERKVTSIRPVSTPTGKGYEVDTIRTTSWFRKERQTLRTRKVVLAAGVLGTLELLFRSRDVDQSLPDISHRLGHDVRTNSEALVGISEKSTRHRDHSQGIAISSGFYPDSHTHIEPVRYPAGSDAMRFLAAPMADGFHPMIRVLRFFWNSLRHPINTLRVFFTPNWARRTIILLVMQTLDNKMRFTWKRRLVTLPEGGPYRIPSYIPVGHEVARNFARKINGVPQNAINEVLLNIPTTAHILGGCAIGASPDQGVVDINHEVFGYPGLYVCDGSVIPANLGVNPSLTITALTERAMSRIPAK